MFYYGNNQCHYPTTDFSQQMSVPIQGMPVQSQFFNTQQTTYLNPYQFQSQNFSNPYVPINPHYIPQYDFRGSYPLNVYWRSPHSYLYPNDPIDTYPSNKTAYYHREIDPTLQNLGNSRFKNWYLDIDGNTGALMLSEQLVSGAYWKLNDYGNGVVSLQNLGNSRFRNWYLDIDGNTGALMLSERLVSGAFWKLNDYGNGVVSLQNLGNSRFKNWYLDIDGNTGALMLSEQLVSGAFWRLSTTETTPQPEMTTLTKTIASFHYPAPTPRNPFGTKLYRVYLEVTVPKSIANTAQAALDRCMEVAKAAAYYVILPFLTPATMSGLPAAIPGALAAAIKAFGVCVASEPRLYPHANRIKVDIKSNRDA